MRPEALATLVAVAALVAGALLALGCEEGPPPAGRVGEVSIEPAPPALTRLTEVQYQNAVRDLLGDGLALPPQLEPDLRADGLRAIGATVAAVSPRGVELYADAAASW